MNLKTPDESKNKQNTTGQKKIKASLYQTMWRWHFYVGLICTPVLFILAFSGTVYVFKPQIDNILYQDLYYVHSDNRQVMHPLLPSDIVAKVSEAYPGSSISGATFYDENNRSVEVHMRLAGKDTSVFVNPANGELLGTLNNKTRFTEFFKNLHGQLVAGGMPGKLIVELSSLWGIILLLTGLFVWWPKNKKQIWGTYLPRFKKGKRIFWRDMHSVTSFWLTFFIFIAIVTGLPWAPVSGKQIDQLAGESTPPFATSYGKKPESVVPSGYSTDAWSASEVLKSGGQWASSFVSMEYVQQVAQQEKISSPYTIYLPKDSRGVYTIGTPTVLTHPTDHATLNIDQYSGKILSDVRFSDFGVRGQLVEAAVALHEGRLFGMANRIIGALVCIGLMVLIVSACMLWKTRKPKDSIGALPPAKDKIVVRSILAIMIVLGVIMPLVGISILIVFLLDRFVIMKIRPLKKWLS